MNSRDDQLTSRLIEHEGSLYYLRFSLSQRIQHIVLFTCFFLLIATGLPLLFPDSRLVHLMFWFEGSFTLRGIIHRVAAVILLGVSVYHAFYLLFSPRGNSDLREMVAGFKDLRDAFGTLRFNLGRTEDPPRFGRFNFIEKFEYYAVIWGSLIMLFTGAALWFPVQATILFPRWVLDIIRVIHGFEAILAFLTIIIWHMYNVHLNPEVFPMSRVWIDGRMDLERFRHHHPLEFERLVEALPEETARRVRIQLGEEEPPGAASMEQQTTN
jgi:formate dehydrogenase subunit gamma